MGLFDFLFSGGNPNPEAPKPSLLGTDLGNVTAQAPVQNYSQFRDNYRTASILNGFNQSLLGGIAAMAGDATPIAYTKYLEDAQKLKAGDTANQLNGMTLKGYQDLQATRPGPNTAPASLGAAMPGNGLLAGAPSPSGGLLGGAPVSPTAAPSAPGSAFTMAPNMSGAESRPVSAPPATGAPLLSGQQAGAAPPRGQPRPLFDVPSLYQQYQIAARTPGMSQIAAQLLQELNKGVPEGSFLGADGGIYRRTGADQADFQKSFAQGSGTSQGQLPADLTKITAQADADIRKAGPIAYSTALAQFPFDVRKTDLSQQGAARFEPQTYVGPDNREHTVSRLEAFGPTGYGAPAAGSGPAIPNVPNVSAAFASGQPIPAAGSAGPQAATSVPGLPGKPVFTPADVQRQQNDENARTEVLKTARDTAKKSADAIQALQSQSDLLDAGFKPGSTAEFRAGASTALQGLGVSEKMAKKLTFGGDAAAVKVFNANAAEIVQQVAKSLGANPTDNDARLLQQTVARASDAPSAARAILEYATKKHTQNIEYSRDLNASADPVAFEADYLAKKAARPPKIVRFDAQGNMIQ